MIEVFNNKHNRIIKEKRSTSVRNINCVCDTKVCREEFRYLQGYSDAIFNLESSDSIFNHYFPDTNKFLQNTSTN